jgi:hypothetical protein
MLQEPAAFAFEFRTARAADSFQERLLASPRVFKLIKSERFHNGTPTVRVLTEAHESITDLALAAGPHLLNFYDLPLTLDALPASARSGFFETQPLPPPPHAGSNQAIQSPRPVVQLNGQQRIRAVIALARAEYHRHFRRLWKGLNVLLANVLPFGLLSILTQIEPGSAIDFFLLAAVMLVASAAMGAVWGIEIMSHPKVPGIAGGRKAGVISNPIGRFALWAISHLVHPCLAAAAPFIAAVAKLVLYPCRLVILAGRCREHPGPCCLVEPVCRPSCQ